MEDILNEILYVLKDNTTSNIIAILSLVIAFIAVIITVVSNIRNNIKYINSLKPMLTFKMYEKNGFLILAIKNNGKTEATNIKIDFLDIKNNGNETFLLDEVFKKEFMLYPTEETQGIIAVSGENIDIKTFPNIRINITYIEGNDNKEVSYTRSIVYRKEIQIKDGLGEIAEEIRSIAYSNNRIANYIEGRSLYKFDELNVFPKSSLYRDMRDAINNIERDDIEEKENDYDDKMEIIKELNDIFEVYKNYMIEEYKTRGNLDFKLILINSVLNRSVAIIEAYKKLLNTNNIIALNSLTRMQIDNCIFVYAIFLLSNDGYKIEEISKEILINNKKISEYKINKQKLYDTYIVSKIDEEFKNKFEEMYNFYCRFIHFSDSALLASMSAENGNILELELSKNFSKFKRHILENGKSFVELCKFLLIILNKKWKGIETEKL